MRSSEWQKRYKPQDKGTEEKQKIRRKEMELVREKMETQAQVKTQVSYVETEAEKHNAMIKERYRRLQDAEAEQFASIAENAS